MNPKLSHKIRRVLLPLLALSLACATRTASPHAAVEPVDAPIDAGDDGSDEGSYDEVVAGAAPSSVERSPTFDYCETIDGVTWCSSGGRKSIIKLPTGEVVCGPGKCVFDNHLGSFRCAPNKYARIAKKPDADVRCYKASMPVSCSPPARSWCRRR